MAGTNLAMSGSVGSASMTATMTGASAGTILAGGVVGVGIVLAFGAATAAVQEAGQENEQQEIVVPEQA